MPELPEVETTKTSLMPLLGQKIVTLDVFQPKLRWPMPDDLDKLVGATLEKIERRAKYLILSFSPAQRTHDDQMAPPDSARPYQLLVHLGMSGSLQQHNDGTKKRKHDHLIIVFSAADTTKSQLHYYDPRRFGSILWYPDHAAKLLNHLGPEPLSEDFTADYLYSLIQRTDLPFMQSDALLGSTKAKKKPMARPIKSVIMEQQIVVGVGNIYATESLYLSGIHPATPAHQLSYEHMALLVNHIKTILQKAIALGGSTLRDFTVSDGQTGYFQQTLNVYGRQGKPCPHCHTTLQTLKLNGRASVFCPTCQPM